MFCMCIGLWFGLISAEVKPTPPPAPQPIMAGWVSQYADGVMEAVVENRVAWGHLSLAAYDHTAIAVLECDRLGEVGTIIWTNGETESYIVTDCANPAHDGTLSWMEENRIVMEVSAETARRRGFEGAGGVWARLVKRGE